MRFLSILFICCFLTMFSAQGQSPTCPNYIFANGNAEQGIPTLSDEDIANAVGFSPIWSGSNWAEYYPSTFAPAGYTPPAPADGNYVSCWISNSAGQGNRFREGFEGLLDQPLAANSGLYDFSFDMACLGGWGNAEIAVYGVYNPSNITPNRPTGAFTPTNPNLFGPSNTVLLGTIQINLNTYNHNKVNQVLSLDASTFPANGITHFFVTNSDNNTGGIIYTAFDNFCITPIATCTVTNRDLELGTPTLSDEDIANAVGFSPIWSGSNWAEHYPSNFAPAGYTPPAPADGNYVSCWISNSAGQSNRFREGFKGSLDQPVAANSGWYDFSFDIACLGGWGNAEVAVYGIYNPNNTVPSRPTGAFTPTNPNLFGPNNTVLLGTVPINLSTYNHNKTNQVLSFNSSSFPANGITHFFVTNSDNNTGGIIYTAFDNFCLERSVALPCPTVSNSRAECGRNGNYIYTFNTTTTTGSVTLSSPCGTFSPSTVTLTGATSYSVTFIPNGSCSNNITTSYSISNSAGIHCSRILVNTVLPDCGGCQCDEDFFSGFMNFLYGENCPNDIVYPTGVEDDCDRVDWYIDGNYVGSSTSTSSFSFPHRNYSFVLCMKVTRTTTNGKVCKREVCREITPRLLCGPGDPFTLLRLNVSPNPATTQVSVSWDSPEMPDNVSITIFNSSSIPVKVLNDINSFDGNTQINIADLPTGMYYISVQGEGYVSTPIKFIKK